MRSSPAKIAPASIEADAMVLLLKSALSLQARAEFLASANSAERPWLAPASRLVSASEISSLIKDAENLEAEYFRTVVAEKGYANEQKELWVQLQKSTSESLLATPSTRGWGHHDVYSKQGGDGLDAAVAAAVLAVKHLASVDSR
jgi:hypothetical protein